MKKIVLVKEGAIKRRDITKLEASGYVVIETNDMSAVKTFEEVDFASRDVVFEAMLEAFGYGNDATVRYQFGVLLREKLLKKIKEPKSKSNP